jgi:histidine phosphotransferase ChpT
VHLLHSRVLHDLAGPVGAIANGLELAKDMGGSLDTDAMQLVAMSIKDLSERLRFYRVAFGLAPGAVKSVREARSMLTPAVIGGRNKIVWPEADSAESWTFGDQSLKLLLNMILLSIETLPRGGSTEVFIEQDASLLRLTTVASGQGARIDDATVSAIEASVEIATMTPRSIHGFFVGRMAESLGGQLNVDYPQPNMVAFRVGLPR